jgi:hypothetical protein
MLNRPFRRPAQEFLVWREGKSVEWRCTYADLGRATGLSSAVVRRICRRRGWTCLFEDDMRSRSAMVHRENIHNRDAYSVMQESLDHRISHV